MLSERFQKTFISVREFIESWDKEIYELNHLDFFIYLLINHVGNRLDRQFFTPDRQNSPLFLDFENLGTLCFNLGDSLEYFLQDHCFGSCSLNCPLDMDNTVHSERYEGNDWMRRRIDLLQSFLNGSMVKEQCLRVDIMNHVILETLVQFYSEELGVDFGEDDVEMVELAEFIENVIIDFIRLEGQGLLQRPFDSAMDYFEELLDIDEDYAGEDEWQNEGEGWTASPNEDSWQQSFEEISRTLEKFLEDYQIQSPDSLSWMTQDVRLFQKYLMEIGGVYDIYDLKDEHILEFLAFWLVKEYVMEDEAQVQHVFRTMARLVTWMYNNYGLDFRRPFLEYYEQVKREVPRVIRALNTYLNEYNIFNVMLNRDNPEVEQISGFFEVKQLHSRIHKIMDLADVHFFAELKQVQFDSSAFLNLRPGDILHATLMKQEGHWEVLEIHYIYPNIARTFIH